MPIESIDEQTYKDYVLHLKSTLDNDVSINSYLRDLITTFHFFMNEGYLSHFKMQAIKVDKSHIKTYNENELQLLLKKPNVKKCSFTEYCSELTSITIPDSVTSIGFWAFSDCTGLKKINYCGTYAQWNAIYKGDDWDYNTGNYTITYNYTGE